MISATTHGLRELLARLDRIAESPRVYVSTTAIGVHRSGTPNITILKSQEKKGRAPGFMDPNDTTEGMEIVRELIAGWQRGDQSAVVGAADRLGALMVERMRQHIDEGASIDGPMAPLSERYKAYKKYTLKADDKPILVVTGELQESVRPKIAFKKGGRF